MLLFSFSGCVRTCARKREGLFVLPCVAALEWFWQVYVAGQGFSYEQSILTNLLSLHHDPSILPFKPRIQLRAIFYSFMTIAQNGDVKAQKRGLVQISYSLQRSMPLSPLDMFKIFRLRSSLPVRIAAHHICGNSPIQLILSVLKRALPATALCRLQIHLGTCLVP